MYRIAVMGDRDSIYGFASVGLEPHVITDIQEAKEKLKSLVDGDYGIIYITEKLAAGLKKEIEYYQDRERPAIILIPGISGNTGIGIDSVRNSVIKAVGSDIIFGGN